MAPTNTTTTLLSPAELSFLHSSLSAHPPIRPDLRTPTEFRPLIAETDVLPSANGSARVCFSDGTESIVGVKAEVEKSVRTSWRGDQSSGGERERERGGRGNVDEEAADDDDEGGENKPNQRASTSSQNHDPQSATWLEVTVSIPTLRDDDNLPIFLSSMLSETLLASGHLQSKLYINARWHWKLYIDVLLLSAPLSYPLPLLSLTTHLALLRTSLPRVVSEPGDDPLFDDDWAAAVPLYEQEQAVSTSSAQRPPIILLVMTVGENIIFDPSKEELAVAESVLAISVTSSSPSPSSTTPTATSSSKQPLTLLAVRTIDPPSRLTPPGIPNSLNPATNTNANTINAQPTAATASASTTTTNDASSFAYPQEILPEHERADSNVWSPPRGGMKRALLARIIKMVVKKGGVGEEVMEGLAGVET